MRIVDVNQQPSEEWRAGVTTRMRASAANGCRRSFACSSNGATRGMARQPICMQWRKSCAFVKGRPMYGLTMSMSL